MRIKLYNFTFDNRFLLRYKLGVQLVNLELTKVNTVNLGLASLELWKLFKPRIKYLPPQDREFIELAFLMMVERHDQQRRKSGEFYITHPVGAALYLLKLAPDKETIAAMLLHDVPEDTFEKPDQGLREIEKIFGPETAFLVSGITKLGTLKYRGDDQYTENLRKLFVAMSQDLRVIFIKLCDRLHNLETLKALPRAKSQRIALESLEIYAPIAERLGMSSFRSQIEELAFPFAFPEKYKSFLQKAHLNVQKRVKQVKVEVKSIKKILEENSLKNVEVVGRAKKYYSIYRKMLDEKKDLEQIYDLVALRIITKTIANCYQIMTEIYQHYEVFESRVKDYIKEPKENGYRSIHLTVKNPVSGLVFEFQIRTKKMHEFAEFGIASHWSYKDFLAGDDGFLNRRGLHWMNQVLELDNKKLSSEDYLKHLKLNLFPNRIFVLTPKGDVIDLPKGATPVDFAFKIHEFIGSHAVGAKVNGKMVKLNSILESGMVVEILTAKNQKPSIDWLGWVQTRSASKNIRAILRTFGIDLSKENEQIGSRKKN